MRKLSILLLAVFVIGCGGGGGGSDGTGLSEPAAPSNLQATPASSTAIHLTWSDTSDNEDGFRVYRGTDSMTVTTLVATLGEGITSCPDAGLAASTTWYYKVTAYNSAGESAASNVAGATTHPPLRPRRWLLRTSRRLPHQAPRST